jgi:adenine-specific DNA-methyltransferase
VVQENAVTCPPAELQLARLAVDLGACKAGGALSEAERYLVQETQFVAPAQPGLLSATREEIIQGSDPLGDTFCRIRPPSQRRDLGAYFTGRALLDPMLDWALAHRPARLVDAGCGSGRFAVSALRRQPSLQVVAVDIDPLATLLTRAALAVLGARQEGDGRPSFGEELGRSTVLGLSL